MKYTPSQIREKADHKRASAALELEKLLPPMSTTHGRVAQIVADIVSCAVLEIAAAQLEATQHNNPFHEGY